MTAAGRPTDDALWASMASTLREVILPALEDEWARAAAIRLIGLATYAGARGDDPTDARVEELRVALDELGDNELVTSPRRADVLAACAEALVAAVGCDDDDAVAARTRLRPLLLRHLDEDLAENAMLMGSFIGRVPDA